MISISLCNPILLEALFYLLVNSLNARGYPSGWCTQFYHFGCACKSTIGLEAYQSNRVSSLTVVNNGCMLILGSSINYCMDVLGWSKLSIHCLEVLANQV
jgi:hypothetical protein